MSSRASTEYAAWLLDLDGTLYWAPGVKLLMALELALFGWAVARRLRRFRHEHEALRADPKSGEGDPFSIQLDRAAGALGVDRATLERDVRRWMIERPLRYVAWFRRKALIEELRQFKKNGGRTALVSDYPAREKLGALGVLELFEVIVASGESSGPRRLKPDPDGYMKAAQALGVPPASCLVIGDRSDADGVAAQKAGMGFRRIG